MPKGGQAVNPLIVALIALAILALAGIGTVIGE